MSGTLPSPPNPLIGRSADLVAAGRQLMREDTRLLTMTGPPGCGKTRLALALATAVADRFADGVAFVDLGPIQDASLVTSSVMEALGIHEIAERSPFEVLVQHLRQRDLLLVLDNFEHLLISAPLVSEILAACPRLRALATSRAPLHLRWEREWPVSPLGIPDLARPLSARRIGASPAVSLFVERARAIDPAFALDDANVQPVAEICVRLDGLPLAIELAAAQTKVLPPAAVLDRLGRSLDLLAETVRDAPPHHRSFRAALDRSYELMDPAQCAVFRRLSVFAGGWTLEAAGVVTEIAELGSDPLALTMALVDQGLLRHDARDARAARLDMLATIRDYARARLVESGEAERTLERHARHFLSFAETAERELTGREDVAWLRLVDPEHDNLRAALRWAVERGEAEVGLRLAGALWRYWYRRGHLREGQRWLEQLLALDTMPALARAKALDGLGGLARRQGHYERAEALMRQALEIFRELDDEQGVAQSLQGLGDVAVDRGDYARARASYEESLVISERIGDAHDVMDVMISLGDVARGEGDRAGADRMLAQGLAMAREQGHVADVGLALFFQALLALDGGDAARAAQLAGESAAALHEAGEVRLMSKSLEVLALVAAERRGAERAARLLGAAGALRQGIGAVLPPVRLREHERALALARASLSPASFAASWDVGAEMSAEEALAYAIGGVEPRRRDAGGRLTPREREVAALVARGLTNREIAEALVIGERTVETHVQHALRKLDLGSRARLAAWAVEERLALRE